MNGTKFAVKIIGETAFEIIIESVIIPNTVDSIKQYAFNWCPLITVEIPNKVKYIGSGAFMNCHNLSSVVLGNELTTIEDAAFYDCDPALLINLPNPVIKEGYTFTEWQNDGGSVVSEITSANSSDGFEAKFSFTGVTISGRVYIGDATDVMIYVTDDDDLSMLVPVNPDGTFSFVVNKYRWWILMEAVKEGYIFSERREIPVVVEDQDDIYFWAYYHISGSIYGTDAEVIIRGDLVCNIHIEEDGNYQLDVIHGREALIITASKYGYHFTPPNYTFTSLQDNQSELNFVGEINTYTISGIAEGADSISILMTGDTVYADTATFVNDAYSFTVEHGDSVVLVPHKYGYHFLPDTIRLSNLETDTANQDFRAFINNYDITGVIQGADSVLISASGNIVGNKTIVNSGDGYSFTAEHGDNILLTPIKDGYTFSPESITVLDISEYMTNQNFTAEKNTYSVSGILIGTDDVLLTVTGDIYTQQTVMKNEVYEFIVVYNDSITITPTKSGYTFSPESISLNHISEDIVYQNFIASVIIGINSIDDVHLKIYPNPVDDELTIESIEQFDFIEIIDINSNIIQHIESKGNLQQINTNQLQPGIYFIKMTGKQSVFFYRILKI